MQSLRDILRSSLRESLQALTPIDRLSTAWPVAVGHAIAERSKIVELRGTQAVAEVRDAAWLGELRAMTPRLVADLDRVSGIAVTDILFVMAEGTRPRPSEGTMHDD